MKKRSHRLPQDVSQAADKNRKVYPAGRKMNGAFLVPFFDFLACFFAVLLLGHSMGSIRTNQYN